MSTAGEIQHSDKTTDLGDGMSMAISFPGYEQHKSSLSFPSAASYSKSCSPPARWCYRTLHIASTAAPCSACWLEQMLLWWACEGRGADYKHFNLLQRCLMPQCVVKFSWYAETWCTSAFPAQLLIPIVLLLHKEGGCFLTGYCKHIARTSHNSSTPDKQSRGSWSVVYLEADGWRGAWATLSLMCGCLGCFLQQRNLVHT